MTVKMYRLVHKDGRRGNWSFNHERIIECKERFKAIKIEEGEIEINKKVLDNQEKMCYNKYIR